MRTNYKEAKRNCHENIMLLALRNNVQGKEVYHGTQIINDIGLIAS